MRIDGKEATPSQVGVVLGALDAQLPLAVNLSCARFKVLKCSHRYLQLGGLHCFEEGAGNSCIDAIAGDRLTGFAAKLSVEFVARIAEDRAIPQVADRHAPSAEATQDDALQQGSALARGATTLFGTEGTIVVESLPVVQELIPGDVGGERVRQYNGPILALDLAGTALDTGSLAGE